MATKTQKLNDQLNNIVPYFRCSDRDVVKVYYYLWSLHLLYYTQVIKQGTTLHYTTTPRETQGCRRCLTLRRR